MKDRFDTDYQVGQDNVKKWGMDVHPVFFVDNPDNPKAFFGVNSSGHAPKEICSRVSQKELDFIRETIKNGISEFHLGFGITYAYDIQHRSEIENLWR